MACGALVALLGTTALAGAAAAQAVAGDSTARPVPAAARWSEQPRFVMLRSLLVPGWGQAHNRAWLKAAGVAGVEGWLISALVKDNRALNDLQAEIDAIPDSLATFRTGPIERYNARIDAYVGRQWLLAGVLAYALVDAYVDAHFRNFDIEFRHDPALPDEPSTESRAATAAGTARHGGTRFALRWHF